ncbi:hypothetical protein [Aliivibrio fischeri]|uniref:hypothetical protein n=1 Tax=Aliivibrio fischeri TaxID=668 RepID=UPI0007C52E1E|nr:hypothetical protein [Aliivibrio fischeri]MCE7537747.1 hypothetical protein [Aliivibrio fischeri]MCE7556992.1 hypothetical protein [Aliivibrio fischeri]MCE7560630.1 hypothetical protein [Aliivibrio fischeri]MCE7564290.1 hypothetical protein [Aliivibrio fischeri]MCE7567972.1 hypothetical protein [Aliivibrio fischeri]
MKFKVCDDEIFGVFVVKNSNIQFRRTLNHKSIFVGLNEYQKHINIYQRPILIVTESPHVDEFVVNGLKDLTTGLPVNSRPVNGFSGSKIEEYGLYILQKLSITLPDGLYPLVVINALQEQCSEGQNPKRLRTRNFIKLWPNRMDYFERRIQNWNPIAIINACTAGDFYLKADSGELTMKGAVDGTNRSVFNRNFRELLEKEFQYVETQRLDDIETPLIFMGDISLSGLVMYVIDSVYNNTETLIYKTSHPSAWRNKAPYVGRYNRNLYYFKKYEL